MMILKKLMLVFILGTTLSFADDSTFSTNGLDSQNFQGDEQIHPGHPHPGRGIYYDWGRARNGWGYCYQWNRRGVILNGGYPVVNSLCELVFPSRAAWGRGLDGWGYCYQKTMNGLVLNEGRSQSNRLCDLENPSRYEWGRGVDGYTYCYQMTPGGLTLNGGRSVANQLCHFRS